MYILQIPRLVASASRATNEHVGEDVTHDNHCRIDGQHYLFNSSIVYSQLTEMPTLAVVSATTETTQLNTRKQSVPC